MFLGIDKVLRPILVNDSDGCTNGNVSNTLPNLTPQQSTPTASTMVQVVVLSTNGEQRTLRTTALTTGADATGLAVAKALRKTKAAEKIGVWKAKGQVLQLWGWREGKAGTENKHELPPPHDEVLLFGDALIIAAGCADLTAEAWAKFYDEAFGGFEDLGSEASSVALEEDEEDVEDEYEDGEDEAEAEVEEDEVEEDEDGDAEDEEEAEEEEEVEGEDDCCDDEGEGGGGKRRAVRRRTATDQEYRRVELGLRARVKMPAQLGKRAPKWQTASELEEEAYSSN